MYLYDKSSQTIDVYSMTANPNRLKEYREKELANHQIPEDRRVLKASTSDEKVLENINEQIWYGELFQDSSGIYGGRTFHNITPYEMTPTEETRQKLLLDSYCEGNFSNCPVAVVTDPYDYQKKEYLSYLEYLLLTQKEYQPLSYPSRVLTMDNIISIPESLYVSSLLEQGKFRKALSYDITSQLETFDFSKEPISRISINELQKMYQCGLIPGAIECVLDNIEITSQILSRRKK